jgi:hypothetical protein
MQQNHGKIINVWKVYEQEKRKIINKNLSFEEYEKEIWELKNKLKI